MNKLSEKILDRIKEDKIRQRPKWFFSVKSILVWTTLILAISFGSVIFSLVIFWFLNGILFGIKSILFTSFIWFFLLIIILYFSYYNFSNTERGYKYPFLKVVAFIFFCSLLMGYLIYKFNGSSIIDDSIHENIRAYQSLDRSTKDNWIRPEEGFIAGNIIEIINEKEFILRDFNSKEWLVKNNGENILITEEVRIIGKKVTEDVFEACEVFPWLPPRGRKERDIKRPENNHIKFPDGKNLKPTKDINERKIDKMRINKCRD